MWFDHGGLHPGPPVHKAQGSYIWPNWTEHWQLLHAPARHAVDVWFLGKGWEVFQIEDRQSVDSGDAQH